MLEETGLPFELVKMPFPPRFHQAAYLDVNPLGTVPALRVDSALMTESAAICEFLASVDADLRLRVCSTEKAYPAYLDWLHRSDATLTFPLTLILRYSKLEPPERRSPQVVQDYSRWFCKRMECVETALQNTDYLCGNRFTAADACVGYSVYLARKLGLRERLGPAALNYLDRLLARPAFRRAEQLQSEMAPVL
jgi:glutathione S-transferase